MKYFVVELKDRGGKKEQKNLNKRKKKEGI
jgi:hypothetical protein